MRELSSQRPLSKLKTNLVDSECCILLNTTQSSYPRNDFQPRHRPGENIIRYKPVAQLNMFSLQSNRLLWLFALTRASNTWLDFLNTNSGIF